MELTKRILEAMGFTIEQIDAILAHCETMATIGVVVDPLIVAMAIVEANDARHN